MQDHQAMALAEGSPPAAPATAPSQRTADPHGPGEPVAVDFFVDPFSGWACWIPRWPAEAAAGAEEDATAGPRRASGQGLLVRLLGRVGAWFGVCEQTPSGAWRRVHVPRRDPWEPGARRYRTVWSWWC
jgi:hypothetical protein